jgi:hypothetical protein
LPPLDPFDASDFSRQVENSPTPPQLNVPQFMGCFCLRLLLRYEDERQPP